MTFSNMTLSEIFELKHKVEDVIQFKEVWNFVPNLVDFLSFSVEFLVNFLKKKKVFLHMTSN